MSLQPLTFRDFMQKTIHASLTGTVRESSGYINPSAGSVGPLRSWRVTGSHLFGLTDSNRLIVRESPGLPVREGCSYIYAVIGYARSFRSELVTESYLVVPAVCVELVLRKLRWCGLTLVDRVYSVHGGGGSSCHPGRARLPRSWPLGLRQSWNHYPVYSGDFI